MEVAYRLSHPLADSKEAAFKGCEGRWSTASFPAVYAANSRNLAQQELIRGLFIREVPKMRPDLDKLKAVEKSLKRGSYLWVIYIPDRCIVEVPKRLVFNDWPNEVQKYKEFGEDFIKESRAPVLKAPSAALSYNKALRWQDECCYIINPMNKNFDTLRIKRMEDRMPIDPQMIKSVFDMLRD